MDDVISLRTRTRSRYWNILAIINSEEKYYRIVAVVSGGKRRSFPVFTYWNKNNDGLWRYNSFGEIPLEILKFCVNYMSGNRRVNVDLQSRYIGSALDPSNFISEILSLEDRAEIQLSKSPFIVKYYIREFLGRYVSTIVYDYWREA